MIAFLSGILAESSASSCVIDVNGVGYEVLIPVSTFEKLPHPGEKIKLLIHMLLAYLRRGICGPCIWTIRLFVR